MPGGSPQDRPGRAGCRRPCDCPRGGAPVRRGDPRRSEPWPGRHRAAAAPWRRRGRRRGRRRAPPRGTRPRPRQRTRPHRARRGPRPGNASGPEAGGAPGCAPPRRPLPWAPRSPPAPRPRGWGRPAPAADRRTTRPAAPAPRRRHRRRGGDGAGSPRGSPNGRGRQQLAALAAPRLEHLSPPRRGHADAEAVGLPAIALLRLVRALDGSALRRSMPPRTGARTAPLPHRGWGPGSIAATRRGGPCSATSAPSAAGSRNAPEHPNSGPDRNVVTPLARC